MRILLIHDDVGPDARADEADTLEQGEAIAVALGRLGHRVDAMPVGLDLRPLAARLAAGSIDVVFNSMEALGGCARLLAAAPMLVEAARIPMAGCTAQAIQVTSNKPLAKALLAGAGLPTPPWRTLAELRGGRSIDGPVILKSQWEHSSVGLDEGSVVAPAAGLKGHARAAALAEQLERRLLALGGEGFAESFIDGREIVVGLLPTADGLRVLPPAEIVFADWPVDRPKLVGFAAKWAESTREYATTAPTFEFRSQDAALLEELASLARRCWTLFDLGGHARVDFRVDAHGRPWILEVNANPCLTPGAGFSRMLDRAGIRYDEAIEALVTKAAGRRTAVVMGGGTAVRPRQAWREFRSLLRRSDVEAIRGLVQGTGFFSAEEVGVACELVENTLASGSAESGYEFLLADDANGGLAGYACFGRIPLTADSWDLYWIVVDASQQGRGLGRALVQAVEGHVAERGGSHLYAETAGRAQYGPTRAFYEACKFEVAARMRDFYAPGDDKVVYVRRV